MQNKEFIYRGLDWEKISTFTQRISAEFPASQLMSSNTPPDERTRESDAQFVQVCCVKPVPNLAVVQKQQGAMEGYTVPDKICSFYQTNDVQSFQYDRPFHKGFRDKDNEFKTLWVERSTYMTTSPLPGILRWFEVEKVAIDEITPIDHACEIVANKNAELRHLAHSENRHNSTLKLTQSLQGVIDAAVNGGVAKYADAFFSQSYIEDDNHEVDQSPTTPRFAHRTSQRLGVRVERPRTLSFQGHPATPRPFDWAVRADEDLASAANQVVILQSHDALEKHGKIQDIKHAVAAASFEPKHRG